MVFLEIRNNPAINVIIMIAGLLIRKKSIREEKKNYYKIMKPKSTKTLQIITGVYSAFYVIAILSSYFEGELSFSDLTDNLFFYSLFYS